MDPITNYILEKVNYTTGDLKSHHGVAAIIYDKSGKILMLDHVKFNFWTIPVGKAEEGQTNKDAIKMEVFEETNLKISKFKEIDVYKNDYMRDGNKVTVIAHIYEVHNYTGIAKNKEPKKHRKLKFMDIKDVAKLKNISHATKAALKYLRRSK